MALVGFAFTESALAFLASLANKQRRQVIRKAKSLIDEPRPPGHKQLQGVETDDGEPVLRVRAGDYRILYVVRDNPNEVIVLDIGNRKDVYKKMGRKKQSTDGDEMRMPAAEFDRIMERALGASAVAEEPPEPEPKKRRTKKKAAKKAKGKAAKGTQS